MGSLLRWHRRWFIPLTAVAAAIGLAWWWVASSAEARLRASGAPTTLAEVVADPIPDEENVAAGLRDLRDDLGEPIDELSTFHSDLDAGAIPLDRLDQANWLLRPHEETINELLEVIGRPDYASLLTVEDLSPAGLIDSAGLPRQAARLLSVASHVALAEGRANEAARITLAALRLGKLVENEPSIIRRQIATAVQTHALRDTAFLLASSELPVDLAQQLDAALASIEDRSQLTWALESERVIAMEALDQMPLPTRLLERGGILRVFENAIRVAGTPLDQLAAVGKQVGAGAGAFGGLMTPSIESLFASEARVGLQARGVRESLRDTHPVVAD